MKAYFKTPGGEPEYHKDKLIVKLNRQAGPAMSAVAAGPAMAMADGGRSPGISALHHLFRAGMIKRATPVSRRLKPSAEGAGPARMFSSLAASVGPELSDAKDVGVNFLDLHPEADAAALCHRLASDPAVDYVAKVPVRYLCVPRRGSGTRAAAATPAVSAPGKQWNLEKISWQQARMKTGFKEAGAVKVAVLDTGIDSGHPDLAVPTANYTYAHPLLPTASGPKDQIGHGTHVAGIIAAALGNSVGINGICRCDLSAWKIFDDEPDYNAADDYYHYYVDPIMYHAALLDCITNRIDVVNLSIGGTGEPDPNERSLFEQLIAGGTTVVAAMGNERKLGSPTSYPAAIPGVIAVGATNLKDKVADFSNRGQHISIAAPGETIWSTLPTYEGQTGFQAEHLDNGSTITGAADARDTDYAAWSGTSMASPHVAAAAALWLAQAGHMPAAAVRDRLMATADKVPTMGAEDFHPDYGAGRLNLLNLLS